MYGNREATADATSGRQGRSGGRGRVADGDAARPTFCDLDAVTSSAAARRAVGMFLCRAVTDQANIGAVAPTSRALARRLAGFVPREPGIRVVELGAGTGTISKEIGHRLGPAGRHVALDRDPTLLAALDDSAPWAQRLVGDVRDLAGLLAAIDVDTVDVVVSSLPWSNFEPEVQQRVLEQIGSVLDHDGVFATIAYRPARLIPGTRAFRTALQASFLHVRATDTVWRSVPPARVIVCRRPRRSPIDAEQH